MIMRENLAKSSWWIILIGVIALVMLGRRGGNEAPANAPAEPVQSGVIPYPDGTQLDSAAGYEGINNHLDSRYFVTTNDWFHQESTPTLTILPGFQTYQQTREENCGPASILMVLHHYGIRDETEESLAQAVDANDSVGTTVENLRDYFVQRGWQVDSHVSTQTKFADSDDLSEFVRQNVAAGRPIIVNWSRMSGHWEVIIGIDTLGTENTTDDVLILADPYDTTDHLQDGYFTVGIEQFFYEWHEGLCAGKTEPYWQTYVIATP